MAPSLLGSLTFGFLAIAVSASGQSAFPRTNEAKAKPAPRVAAAVPVIPASPVDAGATFRQGDSFELRMTGMPLEDSSMYSLQFTIGTDGYVNVPLGGLVRAAGLSQSQLEKAIEQKLIDEKIFRWPTATINVPAAARYITVGGAVRAPNRIPWSSDLTVRSALTAAGGAGDFGGNKVELIRNGKTSYFDLRELRKDPSKDARLMPGDQLELR